MHTIFDGDLAVKLHANDVNIKTSANGNPDKTTSPWGGFTVLGLLTTKALVLFGFISGTSDGTTPES